MGVITNIQQVANLSFDVKYYAVQLFFLFGSVSSHNSAHNDAVAPTHNYGDNRSNYGSPIGFFYMRNLKERRRLRKAD